MAIGKNSRLTRMKSLPSSKTLYALTGFLGCSSDWDFFCAADFGVGHLIPVIPKSTVSLESWGADFSLGKQKKSILLGYSLGGRLALHAILSTPSFWEAAIIVSAHPGLLSESERKTRLLADETWANRFLSEDWDPLLNAWNQQSVLKTSVPLKRNEKDYDRKELAQMLRTWSLGKQRDLREEISRLSIPVLWITGERDLSYNALSLTVFLNHPLSRHETILHSGHRVPWDAPTAFKEKVTCWVKTVLCD